MRELIEARGRDRIQRDIVLMDYAKSRNRLRQRSLASSFVLFSAKQRFALGLTSSNFVVSRSGVSTPERDGTPSGTRTLDTLIKSQVLYQLS